MLPLRPARRLLPSLAACLIGVWLGRWLDGRMGNERPLFAVFLTIFFMLGTLYSIYRQLLRD